MKRTRNAWLCRTVAATLAAVCAIASAAADAPAAPQGAAGRTVRLLTVGNSFSQNATHYLGDLAAADGSRLIHHGAVLGGATMSQHWAKVEFNDRDAADPRGRYSSKRSLREELAAEKWDFVTIQQASIRSHDVATYRPWAGKLAGLIRKLAPQAELLVHQTWAYRCDDPRFTKPSGAPGEPASRAGMHAMLTRAYDTIAAELGARVLPVGDAFDRADSDPERGYRPDPAFDFASARPPALPDQSQSLHAGWRWTAPTNGAPRLTMDGHHAGLAGEYLGACVWYEVLFKTSVLSNRFVPRGLDAPTAEFLRRTAHAVVEARKAGAGRAAASLAAYRSELDACRQAHGGSRDYPLTWERRASQARYEGLRAIAPVYAEQRLAAPHTWHAAEAFLLLLGERAEQDAAAPRRGDAS